MLRFQYNPDIFFKKIISIACEASIDRFPDYDEQDFESSFPRSCKAFSKNEIYEKVKELKRKNEDAHLWELNDYHYCLIYELLYEFCAVENDMARSSHKPIFVIGKCKIYEIDFEEIVEDHFFDEDFLIDKNQFLNMTHDVKDSMGFAEGTFGVIMGLKAHPDELKIKMHKKGKFVSVNPKSALYKRGSRKYPSY